MKDNDQEMFIPKNEEKKEDEEVESTWNIIQKAMYELVGTFMFILVICFCKGDVTKFVFGFWVILCIFGKFSGGHVNPAITLGFFICDLNFTIELRKLLFNFMIGLRKLLLYSAAQFIGAYLGALLARNVLNDIVYVKVSDKATTFQVMFSEFMFTGTFCFVILWVCSKITSPTKNGPICCAVIVSWFYLIVHAGSQLSGAAYNPAILTVLNCIAYTHSDGRAIHYLLNMISAQLAGAVVFAFIFKFFFESYYENRSLKKTESEEKTNLC